ncbi:MAG: hypothetical protein NTW86_19840 [Candidatus Sumerlaeota bacterium]|nr:hypothetical protein [Candidatus Sumerlaeota bacterium]
MATAPRDDAIDIEAIMEAIRRQVREEFHGSRHEASMYEVLQFLEDNCHLALERPAEKPADGARGLAALLRRRVFEEVKNLIGPLLDKQTEWNRKAALILQQQEAELERLRRLAPERAPGAGGGSRPSEAAPPESASPSP